MTMNVLAIRPKTIRPKAIRPKAIRPKAIRPKAMKAVIFDLGGTLVDKYSRSPLLSLKHAFKKHEYYLTDCHINMYMGLSKPDHIRSLLIDYYREAHRSYNHREYDSKVKEVYKDFHEEQLRRLKEEIHILPGVMESYEYLRYHDIKVGVTTGYSAAETHLITRYLQSEGIVFDAIVSSDEVENPRPHPDMIMKNLEIMGIEPLSSSSVLKVDDSLHGLREGLRAGCLTAGVSRYSCMRSLNSSGEITDILEQMRVDNVKGEMLEMGSHFAIDDLYDLPGLIEHL